MAAFGSFGSKTNLSDLNQSFGYSILTGFKRNWPGDILQKSGNCRQSVVWLADACLIIGTRIAIIFIYFSDLRQYRRYLNPAVVFADDELPVDIMLYGWDDIREQPERVF